MDNEFKLKNGSGCLCCRGCGKQDNKLNTYDWLSDIPGNAEEQDMVEVQFKNTRKGYYKNSNHLPLEKGDVVAVEASPGHDIGTVTLTGRLVPLQIKKANLKPDAEIKRIYRKAKPVDIEKYEEAKSREHATMIRSRKIAEDLGLQMKIGDVEYQGDGNKAIFYYIADERVDFRQLIKVLAEAFRVRIEMKQIGARQEAGRIGGIGPCGRELCCATWMKNFVSVSTSAARFQDISLNPQKLAGQCAKLKCCLNYEVDAYVECQKRLPSKEITLETQDATYYYFKADILGGKITYSTDKSFLANEATITARRAFEILNMNRRGEKPEKLIDDNTVVEDSSSKDLVEQESLTRFDKSKNNKKKKPRNNAPQGNRPNNDKPRPAKNGNNRPEDKGENGGQRAAQPNGKGNYEGRKPQPANPENEGQGGRPQRPNRPNRNGNRRPNGNGPEVEGNPQKGEQPERNEARPNNGEQRQNNEARQNGEQRPNNRQRQNNEEQRPNNEVRQNNAGEQRQNNGEQRQNNRQRPTNGEQQPNNEQRPRPERRPRPEQRPNEGRQPRQQAEPQVKGEGNNEQRPRPERRPRPEQRPKQEQHKDENGKPNKPIAALPRPTRPTNVPAEIPKKDKE